jgi:glutathione S-transferase
VPLLKRDFNVWRCVLRTTSDFIPPDTQYLISSVGLAALFTLASNDLPNREGRSMSVLLYGPVYSTYARTARLALEEKAVTYELREIDTLNGAGQMPEHLARHPWGKVPVIDHDGFSIFETAAITRYVDAAFPGPKLQSDDLRQQARMTQICSILDNYGWNPMVIQVFVQGALVPMKGGTPDRAIIATAMPQAALVLKVVESLMTGDDFLCGAAISLADLHLVPILDYFARTEDGRAALKQRPQLSAWWQRIEQRPSVIKTRPSFG